MIQALLQVEEGLDEVQPRDGMAAPGGQGEERQEAGEEQRLRHPPLGDWERPHTEILHIVSGGEGR